MIPYRIIMGIVKFLAIFNAHLCKDLQQNFCDSAKRLVRCNVHQSFLNSSLTESCYWCGETFSPLQQNLAVHTVRTEEEDDRSGKYIVTYMISSTSIFSFVNEKLYLGDIFLSEIFCTHAA